MSIKFSTVKLETSDGRFVVYVEVLPFIEPPEVIIWGSRIFKMHKPGDNKCPDEYRECFAFCAVNEAPAPSPVDRTKLSTTDGEPLSQSPDDVGQHKNYVVLSEEERSKGFVRPLRRGYIHVGVGGHEIDPNDPSKHGRTGEGCGVLTKMGLALCETYARDPKFYGATFCCGCNKHLPVAEFVWEEDGKVVGS